MRIIKSAIFIAGIAVVIAQTLIIREGLTLFGGNELVSGILLCFWLVWTGIGSLIFQRLYLKKDPIGLYSFLLFILSLSLIFSILFFRFALKIFSLPFGEIIGLDKIILISIILLAPTCLVSGALFPAASKILSPQKVYLIEGLGSFFGGLLVSFILIHLLPPFGILAVTVSLLIFIALIISRHTKLLFISLFPLIALLKIYDIEMCLRKIEMGGQNLIGLAESRYGLISVTKFDSQLNFYTSGVFDFSYPDLYTAEETVYYPLLLHEYPQKVLLVGGGMVTSITQIFKHPNVKNVIYLELDPVLFRVGEHYIGENLKNIKNLEIVFGDARYYIKNTNKRFDVVIINLPDPSNGQINRFYTKEFFGEVKRIMNPGGIMSIRITSPPDIISPLFAQYLRTVYNTLKFSFKNILILPVAKTTFIAIDNATNYKNLTNILKERINQLNLNLMYVNEYYIDYNFTSEKLDYFKGGIEKSEGSINTDLKPICYYFSTILWGMIVSENLKKLFIRLFKLNPLFFLFPLAFIFLFFKHKCIIQFSLFSIGATQISIEIILLILFQVLYGYIYGWIGAIIAFFMFGLAVGTFYYIKLPLSKNNLSTALSNTTFLLVLYTTFALLISIIRLPGSNIIIPILIFIGGFLGGLYFPLSVEALGEKKAGILYGLELIGSSLGALVTAVILIPVLGLIFTLLIFIIINIIIGYGLRVLLPQKI